MLLSYFRRIFLASCLILLSGVLSDITAAIRYKTDLLQRMAAEMQIEKTIDSLGDGDHYGILFFKSKPLTISMREGVVMHIGYRIFREELRIINPTPVYDFLERYFLELDLPYQRPKTIDKQIKEDEILFTIGSINMLCDLYSVPEINITRHGIRGWSVNWRDNGEIVCEIHFKNHYELLNGSEMEENERRLIENLANHHVKDTIPISVSIDQLATTWLENYFILLGESYYTDNMTSNMYYRRESKDKFSLLYTDILPVESLANIFTSTQIQNDFNLNIKYVRHNLQRDIINVPLNVWTDYCLQEGCQPFFGVISQNESFINCLIIMKNELMGYIHTLKVEFPIEILNAKAGDVSARLVSYIPVSKIFNLFEE